MEWKWNGMETEWKNNPVVRGSTKNVKQKKKNYSMVKNMHNCTENKSVMLKIWKKY